MDALSVVAGKNATRCPCSLKNAGRLLGTTAGCLACLCSSAKGSFNGQREACKPRIQPTRVKRSSSSSPNAQVRDPCPDRDWFLPK